MKYLLLIFLIFTVHCSFAVDSELIEAKHEYDLAFKAKDETYAKLMDSYEKRDSYWGQAFHQTGELEKKKDISSEQYWKIRADIWSQYHAEGKHLAELSDQYDDVVKKIEKYAAGAKKYEEQLRIEHDRRVAIWGNVIGVFVLGFVVFVLRRYKKYLDEMHALVDSKPSSNDEHSCFQRPIFQICLEYIPAVAFYTIFPYQFIWYSIKAGSISSAIFYVVVMLFVTGFAALIFASRKEDAKKYRSEMAKYGSSAPGYSLSNNSWQRSGHNGALGSVSQYVAITPYDNAFRHSPQDFASWCHNNVFGNSSLGHGSSWDHHDVFNSSFAHHYDSSSWDRHNSFSHNSHSITNTSTGSPMIGGIGGIDLGGHPFGHS